MPLPSHAAPAKGVLYQDMGDEVVLLNAETEKYYGLAGVGARFWQLFSEDGDVAAALATVQLEYAVDAATAERDLRAFLDRLNAAQLLVVED